MLVKDTLRDGGEIGGGLCRRNSRFEPCDGVEAMIVKSLHDFGGMIGNDGDPHLRGDGRKCEPRRHYAKYGVGDGVDINGMSNNGRVPPEAALPQAPA